jgi:hypothetical protein
LGGGFRRASVGGDELRASSLTVRVALCPFEKLIVIVPVRAAAPAVLAPTPYCTVPGPVPELRLLKAIQFTFTVADQDVVESAEIDADVLPPPP